MQKKVSDNYKLMGDKSRRMLVTHLAKEMNTKDNWSALASAARTQNMIELCKFLDLYTLMLFDTLPYATVSEKLNNVPNLNR